MKESFDQQRAHSPSPPTGSRHAGQSCGSATSTASPKVARNALVNRPKRRDRASVVVISACMPKRYRPSVVVVKAGERNLSSPRLPLLLSLSLSLSLLEGDDRDKGAQP